MLEQARRAWKKRRASRRPGPAANHATRLYEKSDQSRKHDRSSLQDVKVRSLRAVPSFPLPEPKPEASESSVSLTSGSPYTLEPVGSTGPTSSLKPGSSHLQILPGDRTATVIVAKSKSSAGALSSTYFSAPESPSRSNAGNDTPSSATHSDSYEEWPFSSAPNHRVDTMSTVKPRKTRNRRQSTLRVPAAAAETALRRSTGTVSKPASSLPAAITTNTPTTVTAAAVAATTPQYRCSLCFALLPLGTRSPFTLPDDDIDVDTTSGKRSTSGRPFCGTCWRWIYDVAVCWRCGELVCRPQERVGFGWLWWHWGCFCCLLCRAPLPPPPWNDAALGADLDKPPLCPRCTESTAVATAAGRMGTKRGGAGRGGRFAGDDARRGPHAPPMTSHVSIWEPLGMGFKPKSNLRPLPEWMTS